MPKLDRRRFFFGSAGAIAAVTAACRLPRDDDRAAPLDEPVPAPEAPEVVRVASVKTAVEGGLLPALLARFEHASPFRVELQTGTAVYDLARDGKVDLVISHYGHRDAEAFVQAGLGDWPRTVFSNQMAFVGPPSDPAKIRGLDDAGEAFRRIAASNSPFVVNDIDGVRYLIEILWNAAGQPDRTGWLHDEHLAKDAAIRRASQLGGYTLWGLTPFLRVDGETPLDLEPLVTADPLLQRMLVSILVKPGGVRRVNAVGAAALQAFILAPATQAAIRAIHYPGKQTVTWVPGGRHNRTAILPKA